MPKERFYNQILAECDKCGNEEIINTTSYTEANEELKEAGWINRKIDDEWFIFCCESCYKQFLKRGSVKRYKD